FKPNTEPAHLMAVSRKVLFMQDGQGIIGWDLATGKKLGEWPDCAALALSADGKRAFVAREARWQVCDSQLKPLRPHNEFANAPWVHSLPDGRLLAGQQWQGRLNVWDPQKGTLLDSVVRVAGPDVGRAPNGRDLFGKILVHHKERKLAVHDLLTDRHRCW